MFRWRSRRKIHLTRTKKVPERSGKTEASNRRESGSIASSYGDPVLEWWRPGGSVLAITRQGSQAYLSLPPSCDGVS
jgi:hypothetical protein